MERDFTLAKYKELLKQLPGGNYTFREALSNGDQFGIIRHDVDRPPKNVVRLAEIEHDYGIKTTYYFRVKKRLFIPDIINKVKQLGHEVGYHYEVLDKAKGNVDIAIKIFREEWSLFNEWDSDTICMHGNPLSRYINKDIWKTNHFQDYKILGEGYLSIDFNRYKYFSDTGRKWNFKNYSLKDKVDKDLIKVASTNELIKKIKTGEISNFYILTHPSKWNDNLFLWSKEFLLQNTKNIIKHQINLFRSKKPVTKM
jgi:hypothetical protein